jgi:hypothetical protein
LSQYYFAGAELPEVIDVSAPTPTRVAKAGTPMRHGGYGGRRFVDARQISVQGVWLPSPGEDFMDMEKAYALWTAQIIAAGVGRLFLRKNWFYNAIVQDVNESKRDFGGIEYDLTFYLADPRQYKLGTDEAGGNDTPGGTVLTWGGNFETPDGLWTPMTLALDVTGGPPDLVTLTAQYTDPALADSEDLIWTPGAVGTTTVYFDRQYAERSGVDVTDEFDGSFFEFPPAQEMNIEADVDGTGTVAGTLSYREARA